MLVQPRIHIFKFPNFNKTNMSPKDKPRYSEKKIWMVLGGFILIVVSLVLYKTYENNKLLSRPVMYFYRDTQDTVVYSLGPGSRISREEYLAELAARRLRNSYDPDRWDNSGFSMPPEFSEVYVLGYSEDSAKAEVAYWVTCIQQKREITLYKSWVDRKNLHEELPLMNIE